MRQGYLLSPIGLWLAFCIATGFLLWPRLVEMAGVWSTNGLYSFCWFVPPVSIFLAWKRRRRLHEVRIGPSYCGLTLVLFFVALTLFLDGSGHPLFSLTPILLIGVLSGTIWGVYGFGMVRLLAFPLLFLLLLLPVPPILISAIDYPLQDFCARVTSLLANSVGIPAARSGAMIYLPTFVLGIAPTCNGLRSSLALLALAVLLCDLCDGTRKAKFALVLLAVPLAYVANFFRLFSDVAVVSSLGSRFLIHEGTWDRVWGFVTFLMASYLLFLLARWLKCGNFRSIS